MADVFSKEKRSAIMASIRSKNTAPEILVFRFLRREGVYFQRHYARVSGKPDIALPKKKRAVFIDGDFWHGRNFGDRPLSEYWINKIQRNILRDKRDRHVLKKKGWKVLRIWASDLQRAKTREKALARILRHLDTSRESK